MDKQKKNHNSAGEENTCINTKWNTVWTERKNIFYLNTKWSKKCKSFCQVFIEGFPTEITPPYRKMCCFIIKHISDFNGFVDKCLLIYDSCC